MEKFKMSYTLSISGSLDNGAISGPMKEYQRETILGKFTAPTTIAPFKSLSFADGVTSVAKEDDGVLYTVTLQNKDLIIEAEILEEENGFAVEMSLSDVLHSLPTIYDENGDVVDPDVELATVTRGSVSYITLPNMTSGGLG